MNSQDPKHITIPLSQAARDYARKFAGEQATQQKSQQVYHNTLAVYAVDSFVRSLNFATDLQAGDSWHPVVRRFHDVADLVIPNLGKIECRPVMPEDKAIALPVEVQEDRIAYVGVQFVESDKVQLLGFVRSPDVRESAIVEFHELELMENLIDYLFRLESGIEVLLSESKIDEKVQRLLETTPISVIVAQLERIYSREPEYEWRAKGAEVVLAGSVAVAGIEREFINIDEDQQEIAAQDLAENLLEKLAEIWGNGNG